MTRGVLANLDVEAVVDGRPLPASVVQRLSAAGTLLRVFSEPGEPLWTPAPVALHRVLPVEGLPQPTFVSGERERPVAPRVAWCAHKDPKLLSRRFDLECERAQGDGLPGARWVDSLGSLVEWLREAPYVGEAAWVLKPPLSAAGRGALRGRGFALLDGTPVEDSPSIAALFTATERQDGTHSGAILESWVERLDDFGCRARIEGGQVVIEGIHRLLVTSSGGFRGVEVSLGDAPLPGLPSKESEELVAAAVAAGARLMALDHEGPFGVDAFAYRGRKGERRFRAQCEVNVRYTFGFVAAALAERVGRTRDWAPDTLVALHFGTGSVPRRAEVPLLAPGVGGAEGLRGGEDTCAWLECAGPAHFT